MTSCASTTFFGKVFLTNSNWYRLKRLHAYFRLEARAHTSRSSKTLANHKNEGRRYASAASKSERHRNVRMLVFDVQRGVCQCVFLCLGVCGFWWKRVDRVGNPFLCVEHGKTWASNMRLLTTTYMLHLKPKKEHAMMNYPCEEGCEIYIYNCTLASDTYYFCQATYPDP